MPIIAPYTRLLALSRTAYIKPYTPPAMKNPLAAHGSAMRAAVSAGPNEPIGKLYAAHSTLVHAVTYFDSMSPKGYNFEVASNGRTLTAFRAWGLRRYFRQ